MSLFFSYLILPLTIFLVSINIYFRLKIIKNYKYLSKKNPNIEPGLIFDKSKDEAFINEHYPENAAELIAFTKHIKKLILVCILGFAVILSIFLYVYFSKT